MRLFALGRKCDTSRLVRGWFLAAKRSRRERRPVPFYDQHGMDEQRAYAIVCLMVGSDADKFHWDISVPEILTCYEMAADFAHLYRDYVLSSRTLTASGRPTSCVGN
jgi:hypothetical protein